MTTYMNHYVNTPDCKVKLTDLALHEDLGGYYLSAKYSIEDSHSIRELDIPKIQLCIHTRAVKIKNDDGCFSRPEVDLGFGFLPLRHDGTPAAVYFTETVIEEKVHEMSLEEIEKKLGYKVKIVSK